MQRISTKPKVVLEDSLFEPTEIQPREVSEGITPRITYTLDASESGKWFFFDFSRGSVIPGAEWDSLEWDLAFRGAKILTNGGDTNKNGKGGVLVFKAADFEEVTRVPEAPLMIDQKPFAKTESENEALKKWYLYNYVTQRLEPKKRVFIIRTADGRFAKMRILSFYCQGDKMSCYTFQYVYQGGDSTVLEPPPVTPDPIP